MSLCSWWSVWISQKHKNSKNIVHYFYCHWFCIKIFSSTVKPAIKVLGIDFSAFFLNRQNWEGSEFGRLLICFKCYHNIFEQGWTANKFTYYFDIFGSLKKQPKTTFETLTFSSLFQSFFPACAVCGFIRAIISFWMEKITGY